METERMLPAKKRLFVLENRALARTRIASSPL
jgi:hypothetical protein